MDCQSKTLNSKITLRDLGNQPSAAYEYIQKPKPQETKTFRLVSQRPPLPYPLHQLLQLTENVATVAFKPITDSYKTVPPTTTPFSATRTAKMSHTKTKTCEKKIKTAELKIIKILNKINSLKLSNEDICRLDVEKKVGAKYLEGISRYGVQIVVPVAIFLFASAAWFMYSELSTKNCLISMPSSSKGLFRPPEDCSMCAGVDDVTRVANISAREFEELYAYNTIPVIVTDATKDWKAIKEFDFKFFREFYQNRSLGHQIGECFFFAYNSGLRSLGEVFAMDEQRANLAGDPWYVGWSTCLEAETRGLREYYARPYFLPRAAESDAVDWLFMGGPGQGAHMHVDSVRHVSWQAQIRGRKQWELMPPPECLYSCRPLAFTVQPEEILVVDTNRWYHRTTVLPGDISITIGAEYD